jgi:hypothetical protein
MSLQVEVLCEIVGKLFVRVDVCDSELSLSCAVADSVKSYVHVFRSLLFHGVSGDSDGSGVVGHDDDRIWG